MAHCPHCRTRVTRTWWFVKVFRGTNHWTTKCPQCHTGCSISISKNESSTSKICAYAAVLGIYLAVSGMVFTFTMQDPLQPAMSSIGFYAGIGGLALFLAGLVGALISDVANSMPTFLGSVAGQSTHSMWPTSDGKFVVTGEERSSGGIQVYEMIQTGRALTFELRDSLTFPAGDAFSVHNQVIDGNRLYNSWYEKGMQVYDINPTTGALEFVASFDTSDSGLGNWGIYPFLGQDKILLSDGSNGLYVVALDFPLIIPTVAQWGLVVMSLLVLTAGTLVYSRRAIGYTAT